MPKWILEDPEATGEMHDDGRYFWLDDVVEPPTFKWTDDIKLAHRWPRKADVVYYTESVFGVGIFDGDGSFQVVKVDR